MKLDFRALSAALCIGIGAMSFPANAGPGGDVVFADGVLDSAVEGDVFSYDHSSAGPEDRDFRGIKEGSVDVKMTIGSDGLREVEITMNADGKKRVLDAFPASAGNPLLMVFMESSLRSMAGITGGSPFYIRNRMREALRVGGVVSDISFDVAGKSVAAQEVVFLPFANDPNAERMGVFAKLALRFVVSDEVPGYFIIMSAKTDEGEGAFHEKIQLLNAGAGQ